MLCDFFGMVLSAKDWRNMIEMVSEKDWIMVFWEIFEKEQRLEGKKGWKTGGGKDVDNEVAKRLIYRSGG